jgi:hypothetical protein
MLLLSVACGGRTIRTDVPPIDEDEIPAGCGESVRRDAEACDGTDLAGQSCTSAGYDGGTLACTDHCEFGLDACTGTGPTCGDDYAEGFEECDGADLVAANCRTLGYENIGVLGCTDSCTYSTTGCTGAPPACGDGNAEGLEECDGIDLRGLDCADFGYAVGGLECDASCRIVTGRCGLALGELAGFCGDGVAEGLEQCDGADVNLEDCVTLGYGGGGPVVCRNSCKLDTRACTGTPIFCGNGVVDGLEECETGLLGGATCTDVGYGGGVLACDASCTFDATNCDPPECGNGILEAGETCDGAALGTLTTCTDHGYADGAAVSCLPSCKNYDVSGCTNPPGSCHNNQQNNLEQCDGTDLSSQSCTTLGYTSGTLACQAQCSFDVSGCSL